MNQSLFEVFIGCLFANTKKKTCGHTFLISMRPTNARKAIKQQTEEFDGETKKGKKKASTLTKTGPLDQQEPHPMFLMNFSSLKDYFTRHIMHQDVAMEQMAHLLVECTYADRLDTTEPILIKALLFYLVRVVQEKQRPVSFYKHCYA